MPKGLHGEVAHNDTFNTRIDANVKERWRRVCEDEGTTMVEDFRAFVASRIDGKYSEIGRLTEMLRRVEEPRDQREPGRAHRQNPGATAFPGRAVRAASARSEGAADGE